MRGTGVALFFLSEHLGWHFGLPHRHPQHDGLIAWMAFWPSDPVCGCFYLSVCSFYPPLVPLSLCLHLFPPFSVPASGSRRRQCRNAR